MSIARKAAATLTAFALVASSTAYAAGPAPVRASASLPTGTAPLATGLRQSATTGSESQLGGSAGILALFTVVALGGGLFLLIRKKDSNG